MVVSGAGDFCAAATTILFVNLYSITLRVRRSRSADTRVSGNTLARIYILPVLSDDTRGGAKRAQFAAADCRARNLF